MKPNFQNLVLRTGNSLRLTLHICLRISKKEREYIESGVQTTDSTKTPSIPWKMIWTSLPFWAILVSNFCHNWGFHLFMSELAQYLSEVFPEYMNTGSKKGLWTAVPYGTMWLVSLIVSYVADTCINNNVLRTATVRKISNSLAHIGPAVCLLLIILLVNDTHLKMTFTLAMFTVGLYSSVQ